VACCLQVKEDEYRKIDKELLEFVEDVLLNRCENATERMLEYAATLEPKCKPTAVRKLADAAGPKITPRLNPIPAGFDPCAPPADLPPVPVYKRKQDPVKCTPAFDQLTQLMQERIIYIDGAMGTMIQRFKLTEADFRCDQVTDIEDPGQLCSMLECGDAAYLAAVEGLSTDALLHLAKTSNRWPCNPVLFSNPP
jgi:hypothetical protein